MTTPQQYQYPQQPQASATSNGMGITGFVTGLLGLIFFWIPFVGIALGILGVVFGDLAFQGTRSAARVMGWQSPDWFSGCWQSPDSSS